MAKIGLKVIPITCSSSWQLFLLFVSQSFDGIELGGFPGRIESEKNPHYSILIICPMESLEAELFGLTSGEVLPVMTG
jgi:hypothetical protein